MAVTAGVVVAVVAPVQATDATSRTHGSSEREGRIRTAASLAVGRDTSAVEPMAFLRQHHPFSELDDDGRAAVAQALQIIYVPAGDVILLQDGSPADAVGVVRKGAVELVSGDLVVDQLEPGDVYGLTSVMTAQPPSMTVRAVEDTLAYVVPASVARKIVPNSQSGASLNRTAGVTVSG